MKYRVRLLVGLAAALTASRMAAQTTFTVTGVGISHYDIDGQSNPTLTVVRGQTYGFNLVNCTFHPFDIQSTAGIGGTRYPNVENNGGTSGTVTLTVPINETADTLFYQCGNHVPMHGVINVVDPTVDSTATPTPTPTPILSQTPSPTRTQTSTPRPTSAPGPCYGDCGGDGRVAINDLVRAVNIALGNAALDTCTRADVDGDKRVSIDELIKVVNAALNGCVG